jgi:hypothetical protein
MLGRKNRDAYLANALKNTALPAFIAMNRQPLHGTLLVRI